MVSVMVETRPTFRTLSAPRELFTTSSILPGSYAVAEDGRFVMIKQPTPDTDGRPSEFRVVVNWYEELRRRAPFPR